MMKTKIEIKSILGLVLFEFEKESNTTKDTLVEAVMRGAYLRGAYLRGAHLQGADLQGAYLRGADLQGADLQGAHLQGADLQGAYLRGAHLWGAVYGDIKIKKVVVFSGLYHYVVMAIIAEDGTKYVRMGCFFRTLEEWNNDFWNNPNEFPNNGSEKSEMRLLAFNHAKAWFELQDKIGTK